MNNNAPDQEPLKQSASTENAAAAPNVVQPKQDVPANEAKPVTTDEKTVVVTHLITPPKPEASTSPVASPTSAEAPQPPIEPPVEKPQPATAIRSDETIARKPVSSILSPKPETPDPTAVPVENQNIEIDNPYLLSGEVDRARLVAQARMFRIYIEANAKRIAGETITRILDIGCGEGQLTQVFAKLYPQAQVIGLDRDEKALEVARRSARGVPNLEYVVGDAVESLPAGPFDLIYESMCFVHIPAYQKIIGHAFEALAPGGLLWSKEMDQKVGTAVELPGYIEIWKTLQTAMTKVGNDIFLSKGLPDLFKKAGFTDVQVEEELLPMGNVGIDGRIMMSIGLGVMYNARKMISKVSQIPESNLENLYRTTVQALMAPGAPTGYVPFANTLARRPEKTEPSQPPVADIENPYMLSGDVDRARLVAQTRLFKIYLEKNAKGFLGEGLKDILDIGCGEGQLTLALAKLYPDAKVIGIDKDEKAIEVAQRAAKGISNVEFRVGDILQGLPEGPFDLVYESMVLMHIPGTPKIIKSIYDVLKPGGRLWTKDLHPNMETAVDHPAFERLSKWMGTSMDRIGAPWRIGGELTPMLTNLGFKVVKTEEEVFTLGTRSSEERVTMAINLGALYNARKLMTRVLQVPEIEMENAYKEIVAAMMAPNGPRGNFVYVNRISEKPATATTEK